MAKENSQEAALAGLPLAGPHSRMLPQAPPVIAPFPVYHAPIRSPIGSVSF